MYSHRALSQEENHMPGLPPVRSFDDLCRADLDQIYQQGRAEVLRDHAFRILLARAATVAQLADLTFAGEKGLSGWTTKELIEISNRFRLLSAPEYEIRLYRECGDETFRRAPRVREFYVLALNKVGRPAEAILECAQLITEGSQNALLWGTLGEAYTAQMRFAEAGIRQLRTAPDAHLDPTWLALVPAYFPTLAPTELTLPRLCALREEMLTTALRMFHHGFRESGAAFTGLGWLLRTLDRLTDLILERQRLAVQQSSSDDALRFADEQIPRQLQTVTNQVQLVAMALEAQGGAESLDYWINAGRLLLLVIDGAELPQIHTVLQQLCKVVDASFKLTTTIGELQRFHDQLVEITQAGYQPPPTVRFTARLQAAAVAIAECVAARERFLRTGQATAPRWSSPTQATAPSALQTFLEKTINFRTLTGTLIPLRIRGALGRVGARVPDLLINRQVQADLADLVETKVIQALPPADRLKPEAISARIQQVVGTGLQVGDLQDLQSPAHKSFDTCSDGLIALSGVDEEMRRYTRTDTDLTAPLLMQHGDCRETMYLNGALFACWQQMQVTRQIGKALLCLELAYQAGFDQIVHQELPALLRYQLRGGQVAVYGEAIAMRTKYQVERVTAADPTPRLRSYGVDEVRAQQPLTHYELSNAKLAVTYRDGSVRWLEPGLGATGQWQPLPHTPTAQGGVPIIPHLEQATTIRLFNLIEDHALNFLYMGGATPAETVITFCDGFYNEKLFASPYTFGSGPVHLPDDQTAPPLLRAGSRLACRPDGICQPQPIYLQFLPFSQTDYEGALVEGDIPETIQLLGRTFRGDLQQERHRVEAGSSPLPALLVKIEQWQQQRLQQAKSNRKQTEQQLARLMLDLAREQPELVQLQEAKANSPLIREGVAHHNVYLVLSGELFVYRHGHLLRDQTGTPVRVTVGGILGEIAALRDGIASATVAGNALVLRFTQAVIQQQATGNPAFRHRLEELAGYRIL